MSDIYEKIITFLDEAYRARMINLESGKDPEYHINLFADIAKVMDYFADIALSPEEHLRLLDYIYQRIKELKEVAHDEHDNRI